MEKMKNTIKTLNKRASQILADLIEKCESGEGYAKIDNGGKGIMAAVIERVGVSDKGAFYSVAHYYTQNGDAMRDPEMIFLAMGNSLFAPTYYLQDNLGIEENSLFRDETGKWKIRAAIQHAHARFANIWMKNIKDQQRL
jgi:hypothetical protein